MYAPKKILSGVNLKKQKKFKIKNGEFTAFSALLVHGNGENTTNKIRYAFGFGIIPKSKVNSKKLTLKITLTLSFKMSPNFFTTNDLLKLGIKAGKNCKVHSTVMITEPRNLVLGNNVRIDSFTSIVSSSKVKIESFIHIGSHVLLHAGQKGIELKKYCGVSSGVKIFLLLTTIQVKIFLDLIIRIQKMILCRKNSFKKILHNWNKLCCHT